MSILDGCFTDYQIDLNEQDIPEDYLIQLNEIDADLNGVVTFQEAQGKSLSISDQQDTIEICTADDLALVNQLIQHEKTSQNYLRFTNQSKPLFVPITTAQWLTQLQEQGELQKTSLYQTTIEGWSMEIIDEQRDEGARFFLIRFTDSEGQTGFCTAQILASGQYQLEVSGKSFDLLEKGSEEKFKGLKIHILLFLLNIFYQDAKTGKPEALERLDAYEVFFIQLLTDAAPSFTFNILAEHLFRSVDKTMKERIRKSKEKQFPQMGNLNLKTTTNNSETIPVYSERKLSDQEMLSLNALSDLIPPELTTALKINGILENIYFEVMADDLMNVAYPGLSWAKFDDAHNKIVVKSSAVNASLIANTGVLAEILIHELGHAFFIKNDQPASGLEYLRTSYQVAVHRDVNFGPGSKDFFVKDYYNNKKPEALRNRRNAFVSIYSVFDVLEFFTEDSLAYLTGETDNDIFLEATHGPKSRSELREKQPEMYLALRLFYDKDSAVQGQDMAFNWTSYHAIKALLASNPEVLTADCPMSILNKLYGKSYLAAQNQKDRTI